ncbi:NP protein [cachavirus 1A]|uniref:NP protein n=2 Tax=Chaphamaparvovirus carnivoran1 TaxID=3052100 RepID=A0A6G8IRQ8_9VIRU|nr:NP protein [cachavirus 1A]QIM55918.1 NP protein [Cachavirus-1B]QOR29541.1 NP [Chaphamaparvovirus carnivoran1]QIM55916.1 NP protein [cachavirus 1A]QOR29544.1 NP [Chaphamaparvovirus carnivoran1]WDW32943.1 NP [Chaphamaparvovirus carnivoran1]
MTSNQLAECRENNNPYNWLGQPTIQAQFGPDPCLEQERARWEAEQQLNQQIAGATTNDIAAIQAGQRSNAPTAQDLASAPAPQLATGYEPVGITDPAIPLSEFQVPSPGMLSMWSPISIDETMELILDEIEWEAMEMEIRQKVIVILDGLVDNMHQSQKWWCWGKGKKPLKLKFKPKNSAWIGKWSP